MANERPYRMMSIDDLTGRIRGSASNKVLLDEVARELEHRSTNRAKALAREVERLRIALSQQKPGPLSPETKAPAARALVPEPAAGDIGARYESLRATFTAEAEILARWGLTALAPDDLQNHVFAYWRNMLGRNRDSHPLGLGAADLARDIKALTDERRKD